MSRTAVFASAHELTDIFVPVRPVVTVEIAPNASADDRFLLERLAIAARLAHRYARFAPDMWADLFQEGCLALVEVVRQAPPQATPDDLEALAVMWMRRRMVLSLARRTAAGQRFPAHALRDWLHLRRVTGQMQRELGREPTQTELAGATGWPLARVADLTAPAIPVALEDVMEHVATDDAGQLARQRDALRVRAALRQLPEAERRVIAGQFGIETARQSIRALCGQMHLSPRRVLALRQHGIILLRQMLLFG